MKPCPFCGSNDIEPARRIDCPVSGRCRACGAKGPSKLTGREADAAWDDRLDKNGKKTSKFNELVDKALLERTAPELAAGFVRYELIRMVSVAQYKQLVADNVKGKGRFDDLVADLAKEGK